VTNSGRYNERNISLVTCAVHIIPKSAKYEFRQNNNEKVNSRQISLIRRRKQKKLRENTWISSANCFIENRINSQN